jgi:hypothetical protein
MGILAAVRINWLSFMGDVRVLGSAIAVPP